MSVETVTQGIDFSWSTAPAFLSNNAMVAAIHRGLPDYGTFAAKWLRLAQENTHVKMPFLVNALECFLGAHKDNFGEFSASEVIDELAAGLEEEADGEAFTSYMAHFTTWQALRIFDLVGDSDKHLKHASDLVHSTNQIDLLRFALCSDSLFPTGAPGDRFWQTSSMLLN